MPSLVARTEPVGPANPLLDLWVAGIISVNNGLNQVYGPVVPHAVEYEIKRVATDGAQTAVVPRSPLDLASATVPGQPGRLAATWAPEPDQDLGRHYIAWYVQMTAGGPWRAERRFFDLVEWPPPRSTVYALPSDMLREGFTASDGDTERWIEVMTLASEMVEMYTGRFFEPRWMSIHANGRGGGILEFGAPVIMLSGISIGDTEPGDTISTERFRVFNRAITQRLTSPDDRDNPRAQFITDSSDRIWSIDPRNRLSSWEGYGHFNAGVQNVRATGIFGYTDWDGSAVGTTPRLIAHATKLIARREIAGVGELGERENWRDRWRLTSERTRDQSWTRSAPAAGSVSSDGTLTGDPEIDAILVRFMRPMVIGAV